MTARRSRRLRRRRRPR
uniref:Uncharacterized protein n=1 Tax=Arundo donax TaxID=35708 RepID=A0A0A8XT33_ARUDO